MARRHIKIGVESGVRDLVEMKHEFKGGKKTRRSVVPLRGNAEVFLGRTARGEPSVVIRPKTSHISELTPQQESVKTSRGDSIRKYIGGGRKHKASKKKSVAAQDGEFY